MFGVFAIVENVSLDNFNIDILSCRVQELVCFQTVESSRFKLYIGLVSLDDLYIKVRDPTGRLEKENLIPGGRLEDWDEFCYLRNVMITKLL